MLRREFLQSSFGALASTAMATWAVRAESTVAARTDSTRRLLYVLSEFTHTDKAAMQSAVEAVGASSFNVLILSFLQVAVANEKLSLTFNGNAFSSFASEVPAMLTRLRSGFGARKRILLSIGGWASAPSFAAIRSFGVARFVRQLTEEIIVPLGLDGIDLDVEPTKGGLDQWIAVQREYGRTLVEITNEYKRLHPTHVVTHAPISAVAAEIYAKRTLLPELKNSLLEATRTQHGNNIDWLNVQFYEGGVVEGGDIADYYCKRLVGPLAEMREQTGITQALSFFTPTFEPAAKQSLEFCQQTVAAINLRCADLHAGKVSGVAIWDYAQIASSIGDWSRGLVAALHS